ncbi:MAG: AI-2E family transporter [Eubacteriales bacterium]
MIKQRKTDEYYDKVPNLHEEGPLKLKQQISQGLGAFLIVAASIVFYFLFLRFTDLFDGVERVVSLLSPVIYGAVIAYLLNPIMVKVENSMQKLLDEKWKVACDSKRISRVVGIIISIIVFLLLIFLLISMLIPQLVESVQSLMITLPNQINLFIGSLETIEITDGSVVELLENAFNEGADFVRTWIQNDLMSQMNYIMSNVTIGVLAVINGIFDFIMGLIISIYILYAKETFLGQCKKTIYALLPAKTANATLHIMKKSNQIFGGFIIGKITDSAIIAVITFVILSALNMPYTLLVSVIIGVTNVIPYFGPFIGAVPCAILILLQNPIQMVYFVIFIIVLQQVDGNIIGPKILGDSTGLSAFWVVFSILLFGGLFGFPGMLVGVPTFAVIYYIVGLFINQKLEKKNLPTTSEIYDEYSYVDASTGEFVSSEEYKIHKELEKEEELESLAEHKDSIE